MSQAAYGQETTQSYAPPTVTQFSVFLTNKVGKLFDLVEAFDGSTCAICALSVHEATDHAVGRLITNCANDARRVLNNEKLPFSEKEVLVVEPLVAVRARRAWRPRRASRRRPFPPRRG